MKKERRCRWCGEIVKNRPISMFCNDSHRVSHYCMIKGIKVGKEITNDFKGFMKRMMKEAETIIPRRGTKYYESAWCSALCNGRYMEVTFTSPDLRILGLKKGDIYSLDIKHTSSNGCVLVSVYRKTYTYYSDFLVLDTKELNIKDGERVKVVVRVVNRT